jgi:hypothetical protein
LFADAVKLKKLGDFEYFDWSQHSATPAAKQNPVIVDEFDTPILYYAANTRQASRPDANIATAKPPQESSGYHAIYNYGDNAVFTGGSPCNATVCFLPVPTESIDYGNGPRATDWFPSAWDSDPPEWDEEITDYTDSFPYYIMDKDAYETTDNETVMPHRRNSFLLISAGKDGKFGTTDDITNFD